MLSGNFPHPISFVVRTGLGWTDKFDSFASNMSDCQASLSLSSSSGVVRSSNIKYEILRIPALSLCPLMSFVFSSIVT